MMDKETIIEYVEELEGIVADVNTIEINSQISFGELGKWCELWQGAVNTCLKRIKEAL